MGNLQVRFLEGWAPAMAPGYSTLIPFTSGLPVIRQECSKTLTRIQLSRTYEASSVMLGQSNNPRE